ncbi:MAG: hypothetical protein AAF371_20385 [Pseudomonadota bacterium]
MSADFIPPFSAVEEPLALLLSLVILVHLGVVARRSHMREEPAEDET